MKTPYIENELKLVIVNKGKDSLKVSKADKVFKYIGLTLIYIFLVLVAFFALLPFYWMILTSLKYQDAQHLQVDNNFFIPFDQIAWSNYVKVFQVDGFDIPQLLVNTLVVVVISTLGTFFITVFASFAFTRLQFKGRDSVFYIFLMTMMIPSELFVMSNFITVYRLGLLNGERWETYVATFAPFLVNVFYIYLLNQSFKQIPNELYLASKVDGKSDWQYLWKVMVPIASPTLITIVILKVISAWNAYAWPKTVVLNDPTYSQITVALRDFAEFYIGNGSERRELITYEMAGTVIVTVPLILLFIFFRKYIMRGVGRAGIKG